MERQGSAIINNGADLEQEANEAMINTAILEAQSRRALEQARRETAALEGAAAALQDRADRALELAPEQDMSDGEYEREMALLDSEDGNDDDELLAELMSELQDEEARGIKRKRHTRRKHNHKSRRLKHKSRRLKHKHKSRRLKHKSRRLKHKSRRLKHKSRRLKHKHKSRRLKHKSRRLRHKARGIGSAIKRTMKSVMGKLRSVRPAITKSMSKSRRKRATRRYDMQNSTIDQKLIDAALYGYSAGDVNKLIRLGGNINAVDHNGNSVIKIASIKGHDHIVELLIGHGVPMPMRSHHGKKQISFGTPSTIRSVKVVSPRNNRRKPSRQSTTRRHLTPDHKSPAGKKLKRALSVAKSESRSKGS